MFEHRPITRSMARAKLIDEPIYIHDALGGYAYGNGGEYVAPQMPPVVAVVSAVAGFVVANAAVISMVGAGLSVVGAVTGNKTLMKIGGIMGIVGGVAGIANAISGGALQSSLNQAAGSMATESALAAETAAAMANPAVTEEIARAGAENLASANAVSEGAVASIEQSVASQAPTGLIGKVPPPIDASLAGAPQGSAGLISQAAGSPLPSLGANTAPATVAAPAAATQPAQALVKTAADAGVTKVGAQTATSGSAWDSILKIADTKGGAAAIQAAGTMASGYAQGQAQQQALDAQNNERKRQIDNVNAFGRMYGG